MIFLNNISLLGIVIIIIIYLYCYCYFYCKSIQQQKELKKDKEFLKKMKKDLEKTTKETKINYTIITTNKIANEILAKKKPV